MGAALAEKDPVNEGLAVCDALIVTVVSAVTLSDADCEAVALCVALAVELVDGEGDDEGEDDSEGELVALAEKVDGPVWLQPIETTSLHLPSYMNST